MGWRGVRSGENSAVRFRGNNLNRRNDMETKTQDDGTLLAIPNKGDRDAWKRTADTFDDIARAEAENGVVYKDQSEDPIEVARAVRKIMKRFATNPAPKPEGKPAGKSA
jgi:hypothetical protein